MKKIFQTYNLNLLQRLLRPKEFHFYKSNKELVDVLIKEVGICLN